MKQANKSGLRSLIMLAFLLTFPGLACPGAGVPFRRFMATAGVNVFQPSSGGYREIYGQTAVMPEIKITFMIFKNFTVWGGAGMVSNQGFIEEVEEEAEIRQQFFSIGAGYACQLSSRLRLRGEIGLAYINFNEEAMQMVQDGSGLGWKIGADLDYFLGKKLFVFLAAACSAASADVEIGKIKLGGLQAGVGLGFAF